MTAREAIEHIRDMISDRHGDYHKDPNVLRYLNRSCQFVSTESESVRSGNYISVSEGQSHYGLESDFLQIDFVGFRYKDERRYRPLHAIRAANNTAINRNVEKGYPIYYSIWGRSADEKIVAPVVWESNATGLFAVSNLPGNVKTHDILVNVTDGSEGVVQQVLRPGDADFDPPMVNGESLSVMAFFGQVGGIRNNFEVGDIVRITSPDRKQQTLILSPPPDFTSEEGEENLFAYYAHKHRVITQAHIDTQNDDLEIDPNLEEAMLHQACYYASLADKAISNETAKYFNGQYLFHHKRAMPRVRQKIREFQSLWFSGRSLARVRDVRLVGYNSIVGHSGNTVDI